MSLETLEEQHARGGDCDQQRNALWQEIRKVEEDVVAEKIETIKLSTRIAVYAGLICGAPGFVLAAIEIYRVFHGCK